MKLFFTLNLKKPEKAIIKWSLNAATFYIFMFWLNNIGNWTVALLENGNSYVTAYPDHIISFGLTTIGF